MNGINEWLTSLPLGAKVTSTAIFFAGVGLWLGGYRHLPERVDVLELEAAAARAERVETLHKLDRVLCLLTLPDSTTPLDAQRSCP